MSNKTTSEHIPGQNLAKPENYRVYYTPQTLAQMWQCSTDVIYDLLRMRKLVGFKVGTGWRIADSAVRDYEENPENQNPRPYPRSSNFTREPTASTFVRVV